MKRKFPILAALLGAALFSTAARAADGFEFADAPGQHLDVTLDGRTVARYMYAHDTSTKERREETYKPFLHVFDAEGAAPITNGAGGKQFPHHRGIYIGWNKIAFNGKSYDLWHMRQSEIVHQKFADQTAAKDAASVTSLTHWNDDAGKPILTEARTMSFRGGPAPARLIIDVTFKLTAPNGDVQLDGDPEHAGVHFRPAEGVDAAATTYVFPKENADATKDFDYAWVGETFALKGKQHSVVHMNHPENPKNTKYSAYRDYGRFGAFPIASIKSGESLVLKYRFLIADGAMPEAALIQKTWDEFAGAKEPSPTPPLTVKLAKDKDKKKADKPAAK